jgi:hypothetical protein
MLTKTSMALLVVAALALSACGGNNNGASDGGTDGGAGGSATDCLVGKWTAVESGYTKSFTFNADLSGVEDQSAVDNNRPFTWAWTAAGKLHIIYPPHGGTLQSEWDIGPLDCTKRELSVLGLVYKKI